MLCSDKYRGSHRESPVGNNREGKGYKEAEECEERMEEEEGGRIRGKEDRHTSR